MAKTRTVRNTTSPPTRGRKHQREPQAADVASPGRRPKRGRESDRRRPAADDGDSGWAEALMDCYNG